MGKPVLTAVSGRPVFRDLRWGVYAVFEAGSDYVRRCFAEYGLHTDATGNYAAMYKPYHLIGLELGISGAYTDAKFTKNIVDLAPLGGPIIPFDTYSDAPKWAGSVFAEITMLLSDDVGKVKLRTDVFGQTSTHFSNNITVGIKNFSISKIPTFFF